MDLELFNRWLAQVQPLFINARNEHLKFYLHASVGDSYTQLVHYIRTEGGVIVDIKGHPDLALVQLGSQGVNDLIHFLRVVRGLDTVVLRFDWVYMCVVARNLIYDAKWAGCLVENYSPLGFNHQHLYNPASPFVSVYHASADAAQTPSTHLVPTSSATAGPHHRTLYQRTTTQNQMLTAPLIQSSPSHSVPRMIARTPNNYAPIAPTATRTSDPRSAVQPASRIGLPTIPRFEPPAITQRGPPAFWYMPPFDRAKAVRGQELPLKRKRDPAEEHHPRLSKRSDNLPSPSRSKEAKYWCRGCGASFSNKGNSEAHWEEKSSLPMCRKLRSTYTIDPQFPAEPPVASHYAKANASTLLDGVKCESDISQQTGEFLSDSDPSSIYSSSSRSKKPHS
ncbi:hypothetical protein OPQ81_009411 [Rhizoctonia solani]|nr:hypothetical protein OPQ81_009411 [Rhizoctonia solani]